MRQKRTHRISLFVTIEPCLVEFFRELRVGVCEMFSRVQNKAIECNLFYLKSARVKRREMEAFRFQKQSPGGVRG